MNNAIAITYTNRVSTVVITYTVDGETAQAVSNGKVQTLSVAQASEYELALTEAGYQAA